jgi:hypothetical protein
MLGLDQIARTWWSDAGVRRDAAARRLRELNLAGLLRTREVVAKNIGPLHRPLVSWRPGERIPDFGALAWRLHLRWRAAPVRETIILASPRLARRFGGRRLGRVPRAFQVSHDLGVAEMFLAARRFRPKLISRWIDEDRLSPFRRGEKLPDAVLADRPATTPRLVLEFGAGYGKSRLQACHDDCEMRGLPYEIW